MYTFNLTLSSPFKKKTIDESLRFIYTKVSFEDQRTRFSEVVYIQILQSDYFSLNSIKKSDLTSLLAFDYRTSNM
jgi:hypothetical protein